MRDPKLAHILVLVVLVIFRNWEKAWNMALVVVEFI